MEHTTTWATDTASFEEDTWMMEALDAAENSRNQAERLVQREKALRVRQQHDGAEANGGADVHAVGPFTVGFTGSPDMLTLANHGSYSWVILICNLLTYNPPPSGATWTRASICSIMPLVIYLMLSCRFRTCVSVRSEWNWNNTIHWRECQILNFSYAETHRTRQTIWRHSSRLEQSSHSSKAEKGETTTPSASSKRIE